MMILVNDPVRLQTAHVLLCAALLRRFMVATTNTKLNALWPSYPVTINNPCSKIQDGKSLSEFCHEKTTGSFKLTSSWCKIQLLDMVDLFSAMSHEHSLMHVVTLHVMSGLKRLYLFLIYQHINTLVRECRQSLHYCHNANILQVFSSCRQLQSGAETADITWYF